MQTSDHGRTSPDRIRSANDRSPDPRGQYVLYWMQTSRRLQCNHALDVAGHWAAQLRKPLVIYEGLKRHYPWANARLHTFALEGMRDNAAAARYYGLTYWPFVETPDYPGHGLVRRLAAQACLVVTDDYPAYIVPAHIQALAGSIGVPLLCVDSNGLILCGSWDRSLGRPPICARAGTVIFPKPGRSERRAFPIFPPLSGKPLSLPFPFGMCNRTWARPCPGLASICPFLPCRRLPVAPKRARLACGSLWLID